MNMQNIKNRISNIHSIIIPILFTLILIPLYFIHNTFEEWDGVMQVFAGKELLSGIGYTGWTSHFWPPLYSFLIGAGSLFLSGFEVAKIISIIASILLLYFAYELAIELSNDKRVGLLTQWFLVLNPIYFLLTLQAENHMLDSLFFILGLILLLKSIREAGEIKFLVTGIVCGLAGLTRYTSYSLFPISIIVPFLFFDFKKAAKFSVIFIIGFCFVSLPWWYYNAVKNGSPLNTWQYLNIGASVGIGTGGKDWWWKVQSYYNGILDIFMAKPLKYLIHFFSNVISSGYLLAVSVGVLAPFAFPAIFDCTISMKSKVLLTIAGLLLLYVLLVSNAFIFQDVFLSWSVILTVLSIIFLLKFNSLFLERFRFLKKYRFNILFIIFLSISGFILTTYQSILYLRDKSDGGELVEYESVSNTLRKYDPNIGRKFIMSVHPARAYYAGSKWLQLPLYYEGSLSGLVSYKELTEKVKSFAPKYPSFVKKSELRADYLIYDISAKHFLPQYSYLLQLGSVGTPNNFKEVYRSNQVVVFEIIWK